MRSGVIGFLAEDSRDLLDGTAAGGLGFRDERTDCESLKDHSTSYLGRSPVGCPHGGFESGH